MHLITDLVVLAIVVAGILEWWLAVRKPPRRWR